VNDGFERKLRGPMGPQPPRGSHSAKDKGQSKGQGKGKEAGQ
jgi:hypothetical protein